MIVNNKNKKYIVQDTKSKKFVFATPYNVEYPKIKKIDEKHLLILTLNPLLKKSYRRRK